MSTAHAMPTPTARQDATLIALVALAHGISHFSQLVLPPLFPWLKEAFQVGYTELGFVLSVFFVVSCVVQAVSGFVVDRFSPRPVLLGGMGFLVLAIVGYATASSYWMLLACAVVAGVGNGVFHPVDYTLFNRKVAPSRLGHAYSAHGVSGNLGWALAPAMLVPLTLMFSWRVALGAAGALALLVLAVLWWQRRLLALPAQIARTGQAHPADGADAAGLSFLRIPAVWMCFAFFLFFAMALGVVQAFAPEAGRQLHQVPQALVAVCLTTYMVASATGMVMGGFLAANPDRCERVVGAGMGLAAVVSLTLAWAPVPGSLVPVLFAVMGFAAGTAGPSRDLLVKRSTPENASGRVYGVVYAGLDIGQAVSPIIFGPLMDQGHYSAVFVGLAFLQAVLIVSAFNVRRVRRTLAPAT